MNYEKLDEDSKTYYKVRALEVLREHKKGGEYQSIKTETLGKRIGLSGGGVWNFMNSLMHELVEENLHAQSAGYPHRGDFVYRSEEKVQEIIETRKRKKAIEEEIEMFCQRKEVTFRKNGSRYNPDFEKFWQDAIKFSLEPTGERSKARFQLELRGYYESYSVKDLDTVAGILDATLNFHNALKAIGVKRDH